MNQILIKPIITERSMQVASLGRFTFEVDLKANKNEIAGVVAKTFNVHPLKVATQINKGRLKRSLRSRNYIKTAAVKKAVVSLKTGEKIDLFDVTESNHEHANKK